MKRAAVILGLLAFLGGAEARAHDIPIGVGSQTIFTIGPSRIEIEFNMGFASLAGFQEMKKFDRNRDGKLSDKERQALIDYVGKRVVEETTLLLDGKALEHATFELTDARSVLKGPLDVLPFDTWWKFVYTFPPMVPEKTYSLTYLDKTYEGEIARQVLYVPIVEGILVDNFMFVVPENPEVLPESFRVTNHRRVEMEVSVLGLSPTERPEIESDGVTEGKPFRPAMETSPEQVELNKFRQNMDRAEKGGWALAIALFLSAFWGAGHALNVLPRCVLCIDRADDALGVPGDDRIRVVVHRFRNGTILSAPSPDTHDALAQFVGVFNLPVNELAVTHPGRDVNDEGTGPLNAGRENLRFDVLGAVRVVRLVGVDGPVPDFVPVGCEQILEILNPIIVFADMADEYIPSFADHESLPKGPAPSSVSFTWSEAPVVPVTLVQVR